MYDKLINLLSALDRAAKMWTNAERNYILVSRHDDDAAAQEARDNSDAKFSAYIDARDALRAAIVEVGESL